MNRLKDKYNAIPAAVRASFWFTICSVIQRGISLFTTPIFTRLLTTQQYGVFSVYNSWYDIISIFATLNLFYGAYNNAITKYPSDKPRITSTMQGLTTLLTIILFVIYTVNPYYFNRLLGLSSVYVYAMFVEMLFLPAYNFWAAGERYDYKYRKLIITTLVIALGSPVLGLIAVVNTSYKAEARVLSYVFVQACVGLIFYIYNLYKGKHLFSKKYWKYALVLNIPLIPHYLSSSILNQADRIMINNMVGTGEAAIYSVAYNIASIMTIITTAIKNTYTPYIYKNLKVKNYQGLRKTSNALAAIIFIFTFIAILLGPEVIRFFAPEAYFDAIWVIPPVGCAVFFKFLYPIFSTVEFFYEKTKMILIASCVGAIANIVLNYFCINAYGYYAAGYTTLFCYILYSFGHYYSSKHVFEKYESKTERAFDSKFLFIISIALLCVMVAVTFLYQYTLPRYIICFVMCVFIMLKWKRIIAFVLQAK